jgi:hypothetical protein
LWHENPKRYLCRWTDNDRGGHASYYKHQTSATTLITDVIQASQTDTKTDTGTLIVHQAETQTDTRRHAAGR